MNKKAETDVDVIFLLTFVGAVIGSAFLISTYWGWFTVCFLAILGIWELISKLRTGRTLTQRFKLMMRTHHVRGWIFIITLNAFFVYLNIHLLFSKGIWK